MTEIRPGWLPEQLYPFDLKTIKLADGNVVYVDEGAGPTLLFVNAGMWSFVFRDVITRLRDEFRCVTLDFPGYGLSPELEKDLEIRGPGEFFGRKQSGLPELQLASLTDLEMLEIAREEAQVLFDDDPDLEKPEHHLLKENVMEFWQSAGDVS